MLNFKKILLVSNGMLEVKNSLKHAVRLAHQNQAKLDVLVVCPEFPKELSEYKPVFEFSVADKFKHDLKAIRSESTLNESDFALSFKIEYSSIPSIFVIRHIIKNGYDLLIKDAEKIDDERGFKAIDMDILRKCPCPAWISKATHKQDHEKNIAVAIDPLSPTAEGHSLTLHLLEISRSLANTYNEKLKIISCWDYIFEEYLSKNMSVRVDAEDLANFVNATSQHHYDALNKLIQESALTENYDVAHVRGSPDEVIPQFITENDIDILVMGTVGRSGIPGFVIGNTAENVLQNLNCSLIAIKPNGFMTPIKAY